MIIEFTYHISFSLFSYKVTYIDAFDKLLSIKEAL